jgi:hypothetical protein
MSRSNRTSIRADALVYAMTEDAVRDLKQLRSRGFVVGNRPATRAEWPRTASGRPAHCNGFRQPSEVHELIHFLTRHMGKLLAGVGSIIDADAAVSRLGLGGAR